jgi:hypothetical protein
MNEKEMIAIARGMLNNRKEVLTTIMKDFGVCRKDQKGLKHVLETWEDRKDNPEQLKHVLETLVKVNERQSEMINQMLILSLVYASGENFTSDSANMLMKLGHGDEAIRSMWNQKIHGD